MAIRRAAVAALVAGAAAALPVAGQAQFDGPPPEFQEEPAWKVRIVKPKTPEAKTPEAKTPEAKAPEAKAPEAKAPEAKAPEAKAPEAKAETQEAKAPEPKTPETKVPGAKAADSKKREAKTREAKAREPKASDARTPEARTREHKAPEAKTLEAKVHDAKVPEAKPEPKAVQEAKPPEETKAPVQVRAPASAAAAPAKSGAPSNASPKVGLSTKANDPTTAKASAPWYKPVSFSALPGWERDDHLAAFQTFLKSCERVIARGRDGEGDAKGPKAPPPALVAACLQAVKVAPGITGKEAARTFFEQTFTPNAVASKGQPGLLTGYYEPVLMGSRTPEGPYQTPIYKRPPDLVNVVDDTQRGTLKPGALTHVRKTAGGTEPYYTRAEIEGGALKGKGLELLYLADSVDVFFMQIQGSGRVMLTDGTTVRVHYDGKNGHPYSSIGRYLIEKAILAADRMSMGALQTWLRADPERGKKVMWQNSSYVFFREIKDEVGSPLGAMRVPLTPVRSVAIDPSFHALGMPIYISAPAMRHVPNAAPFNRLMVGQDVGSAIKGAERGDIFFGSGDEAAKLAGSTRYPGAFFALVPNGPPAATAAGPAPQKAQE